MHIHALVSLKHVQLHLMSFQEGAMCLPFWTYSFLFFLSSKVSSVNLLSLEPELQSELLPNLTM